MASKILITGFDEAGRGPLAGPVSAACVILPSEFPLEILNDSKKMTPKKRNAAEKIIREKACFGIGLVDHKKIDEINILQASLLAMELAYEDMMKMFPSWCKIQNIPMDDFVIKGFVDGLYCPKVPVELKAEPKADGKYPEVMAASILAKTCRDRIMIEMDKKYPAYGYAGHKGYPTPKHREICRKIGPSPIQRLTFHY